MSLNEPDIVDPVVAGQTPTGGGFFARLWREPLLHFVVLGALLFAVHAAIETDERRVQVTAAIKAQLARDLAEQQGQRATPGQLEKALALWKQDEALSREAKREGLDRGDAVIRRRLADKVRALQAALFVPHPPSDAELTSWLDAHRSLYETPLRYDLEQATVSKTEPEARARAETLLRTLQAGRSAANKTVLVAQLPRQLKERFGVTSATRIAQLELGVWVLVDAESGYHALRVTRVQGGLPPRDELHARLVADVAFANRERATARAIEELVARYRFEDAP